jgi:hypothetical protein
VCSPVASSCTASSTTISSVSVDVFDDIVTKSMLLDFRILPFQSNVGYDVILSIKTPTSVDDVPSQIHNTTGAGYSNRFASAHISTTEAYDVEFDVREVNISTFEPDLSTSFDDPVPWDAMPTGMSDIQTQI